MKNILLTLLLAVAALGCTAPEREVYYRPNAQTMPQNIAKIHVRPFINRTQVFALEDRLTIEVVDEFLRNGQYNITNESLADGVLAGEIARYVLVPIQYDSQLVPTLYRMEVLFKVSFIDKATDTTIWQEQGLTQMYTYSASTRPGGMSEEQAREQLWRNFARVIVKRTVEGFGSVRSDTRQRSQPNTQYTTIVNQ